MTANPTHTAIATDIVIVGGGLVGGSLALGLARHGVKSTLVDRLPPAASISPTFDGRASAISASGQTLLAAIGLWPHLAARAQPILDIRVSDGPSLLFLHYDHRDLGEGPLGYMVENRHLREAIAAEITTNSALINVVAPATVRGFHQDADSAVVELADGREITAKLVITAEGKASTLREAAGLRVTGWNYAQTAIVATIAHTAPHNGIAHERFLPAGPFAILPLQGGHRSSLVWTEAQSRAEHYLALCDDRFVSEIAERVGAFLGELSLVGPRFSYPLGLQFAAGYVKGRLVLTGDSAHAIHPIAGQGLNLGLRDVAALVEILVDNVHLGLDPAHPTGLDRYERWRRADNLLMAGVTDILNRLFSNDIAAVRLARDVGLGVINNIAPVKRFFMRHAMGTVGDLPKLMRGVGL